jgi:hypothetical protein
MAAKYKSAQLVPGFVVGYLQLIKKVQLRVRVRSQDKKERNLSSAMGSTSRTRRGAYTTTCHIIGAWVCICECGKRITVPQHKFLHNTPKEHCGCKMPQGGLCAKYNSEYHIWQMMLRRCHDETHATYKAYGAKGIQVCAAWRESFETFIGDMGPRPSMEHSIDRIDPTLGYAPGNVRWATDKQQARNKVNTIRVPHPKTGALIAVADLAEELGISYSQMRYRLQRDGKWPY